MYVCVCVLDIQLTNECILAVISVGLQVKPVQLCIENHAVLNCHMQK